MTSRSNKKALRGITTHSLKHICWKNGFRTVTDLSKSINRSRQAIYAAVRDPRAYPKTTRELDAVLTLRD